MILNPFVLGRVIRSLCCTRILSAFMVLSSQYTKIFSGITQHNNFTSKSCSLYIKGKSPPGAWCEKWEEVSSPKGRAESLQRGAGERADSRGNPSAGKTEEFLPRNGCALEVNPSLPFATAPELFPDPGRDFIGSRVGSYSEFKKQAEEGNQKAFSRTVCSPSSRLKRSNTLAKLKKPKRTGAA